MTNNQVYYENINGYRFTRDNVDGPLFENDRSQLETWMNNHSEHGKLGPWHWTGHIRTL
jgi:hypothetical protein